MPLKKSALVLAILLSVTLYEFPPRSQHSGFADVTFAIGVQDTPTGVYYDRDFDFPTGEAMWLYVPVVYIDVVLCICALACFVAGFWVPCKSHKVLESTVWPNPKAILHHPSN